MQVGARLRTLCPSGIGTGNGAWLRGIGCVCAVVMMCIAGSGTAAASRWAIQSVPASSGGLDGVSCTSDSACMAVGSISDQPGTEQTFAARWNGTRWSIQQPPSPVNGASLLSGLSCTSRTACIAVGSCYCSFFHRPLAARWNGREWSMQQIPHPAGVDTGLSAVSCTSRSACTAVGYGPPGPGLVPQQTVFVERFDGRRWSFQPAPTPAWADRARLDGVSCVSPTLCTAVGTSVGGQGDVTTRLLVERWDGRRWTIARAPLPDGSFDTGLTGVACASSAACTAVGDVDGAALVERWNGRRWSTQRTPYKVQAPLTGVSCVSATVCEAVGTANQDAGGSTAPPTEMAAERWNGRRWSLQHVPQPAPAGDSSWFNAVACASARSCFALGGDSGIGAAVFERYS